MESNFVSVIIPTYKDWARLALCVAALSKQTYPKELFEVIIINNNPAEAAPADFVMSENCKLITEAKPGSYAARNTGLKIASGDIIGFTDSDCIPDKDWIRNAVTYLNNTKSCSRVAGRISVFTKTSKPSFVELYNNIYSFPQKWQVETEGVSVTANLFTYKYIFDKVGLFDGDLMSMGDSKWARLAGKAGYRLDYVENVIVYHPARNLSELVKKEIRLGGAEGWFGRKSPNKWVNIYRFFRGLRPRKREVDFLNVQGQGLTQFNRTLLLVMRYFIFNIRRFERLRVQLGKKPNRT